MVLRKKKKKRALCDKDWTATLTRMLRRVCDKEPARQWTDAGTRRQEQAWSSQGRETETIVA